MADIIIYYNYLLYKTIIVGIKISIKINDAPSTRYHPKSALSCFFQNFIHGVSAKDRKHHAPQNCANITMTILVTPNISSIKYMQQTTYHYTHAQQRKG